MLIVGDNCEELRDLGEYLSGTDELRGCVYPRSRPPGREEMGPVLEALEIAVGVGGAAAATATAIIGWLQSRPASVRITVKGPGERTLDLDARGVSGLDADGLQQLTTALLDTLDPQEQLLLGE
jgi:hypothetical protein